MLIRTAAWALVSVMSLVAAEHHGIVKFGGLPVPGASVTLTQAGQKHYAATDTQGAYRIVDIDDQPFTVEIDMQLFVPARQEFANALQPAAWELQAQTPQQIAAKAIRQAPSTNFQRTEVSEVKGAPPKQAQPAPVELQQRAIDGLLINGSVSNALNSPFSQLPAFGNNRGNKRSLYNGNLGFIWNNAAFDARSFSLTGQNTAKPQYNRAQGLFSFGGPIKIPKLLPRNGPNFTVNYQWTRNSTAATQTGLMPTAAERSGIFSRTVIDPANGAPFPNNTVPDSRISPQARALLRLFPEPNFSGNTRYNFQLPLVSGFHQDDLQTRLSKQIRRTQLSGSFNWQNTRSDSPDLFQFLETGRVNAWNTSINLRRTLNSRTYITAGVNLSRLTTRATPFFAQRQNVSAEAGIIGNNQDPANWGPPNLNFSGGISPISLNQSSLVRNQTAGLSADLFLNRGSHNIQTGLAHRAQQFNIVAQKDARGTFSFTGAAAGSDFAGFLLGVPDASSIAYGNADKYLRGRISEGFINDDWRVNPSLTINIGARWEYWTPVIEKYGRLVTPGPRSDTNNLAPRLGFSWRPVAASSMVVRGGYGIYYDTAIYQPIALEMAQQPPLSRTLRVSSNGLTLANGFVGIASAATVAVDPNFRTGYSQNWQLSVQRDLPAGLQLVATYNGGKGTRAQQQVLPFTSPLGAAPGAGYTFLTSNGNSTRHAGQFQLRRRLRNGLTANLQYTWAKSLDDALLSGKGRPMIAQDWTNLHAERGRSNFDQRHLVNTGIQYSSGAKLHRLLREWTLASQFSIGSGLPLTPTIPGAIAGVTGSLRPDYTGAPLYAAPLGFSLNPAAYATPAPGRWGNAGRNSITGPSQFVMNSSLGRTFRGGDRISMDFRIDVSNTSNTVTFPSWNTVAGNVQFGLPNAANNMRSADLVYRVRF